jgi:uncharacterized protein YukE
MSEEIKVNAPQISNIADKLDGINKLIHNDYDQIVANAMARLNQTWGGRARDKAFDTFAKFKKTFAQSRYEVMNEYVTFLKVVVDPEYTEAEKVNVDLGSLFVE